MARKSRPVPKWSKAPEELTESFARQLDALPPDVERRKMFGYLCGFVNGNMFAGTFKDGVVLRLPPEARERIIAQHAARPFVPMPGRAMKEYVEVPPHIVAASDELAEWLAQAYRFAAALAPKEKKARTR